jgi:NAD kinase
MERLTEEKIILVTGMTRLEYLKAKFNSVSQAKFYVEHLGADFSDYLKEDEVYKKSLEISMNAIEQVGRLQVLKRDFLPNFIFGKNDVVVVLGRDGLVANTLKYLDGQPCIGVNPDPGRWDGVLLPFTASDLLRTIPEVIKNKRAIKEVSMAKAALNNGEILYAVNDLFVGAQSHISARYSISFGKVKEFHSSSGIIISTGLGSTAWLKSIIIGASKIVDELSGKTQTVRTAKSKKTTTSSSQKKEERTVEGNRLLGKMEWDADYLFFSVREPFPSKTSNTDIVFGKVTKERPLRILSLMPEAGVIFSDGIEKDFISFSSGMEAVISVAEKKGRLVV